MYKKATSTIYGSSGLYTPQGAEKSQRNWPNKWGTNNVEPIGTLYYYFLFSLNRSSNESKVRNPYRWLPRKEEQQKEDRKQTRRRSDSPSQDEHIKNVTKDFCSWVSGLGGDSNNVEESTIHSLFASGYATKPALSVPIHVVDLTNVPQELRMSATVSQEEMPTQTLEQVEKTQKQLVSYTWDVV